MPPSQISLKALASSATMSSSHGIPADTRAGLLVSMRYGILDPTSRELTCSKAGHNPYYLSQTRPEVETLIEHRPVPESDFSS